MYEGVPKVTWTTAYKWRPRGAQTTRRFGMGYAETTMVHRDLSVAHATYAPRGDAPFIIDEVTIENRGLSPRTLRHYEYWDVRRRPIEIDWLVSGTSGAEDPPCERDAREERALHAATARPVTADPHAQVLVEERAAIERLKGPRVAPAVDERELGLQRPQVEEPRELGDHGGLHFLTWHVARGARPRRRGMKHPALARRPPWLARVARHPREG